MIQKGGKRAASPESVYIHSNRQGTFFIRKLLISFLFLNKNMLWYSLEAPRRGTSNEYPQHMFSSRNKKNIMWIPPLICSYVHYPCQVSIVLYFVIVQSSQFHNDTCIYMSHNVRKCTSWHVHPTKTKISLPIFAVWAVFIVCMKKLCILGYQKCDQWRFWPDCVTTQDDLKFCWGHMLEGVFFDIAAHCLIVKTHLLLTVWMWVNMQADLLLTVWM